MPNPVIHFEIMSADAEASKSFFTDVFGWEVKSWSADGFEYGLAHTGSDVGIQGGIVAAQDGESCVSFYIAVDDVQAYLDKAVAAGGSVIVPVTVIPGAVTMAMFADPAGAVIGLVLDEAPPPSE